MGWRDVERDFYAGKVSYAPKKKSAVDEGFGTLIRSIGAGMEGRFKQEQMMRLEEEADRKKKREEALAEQKSEEKKNAQRLKAAKSIIGGIGLDPNNTNFTNHVYGELEINGDDVNGTRNMYESLIKDGRLGKVAANSLYKNRGPKPPQIEAQMDEAFKESMSDLKGPREPKGVRKSLANTESRGSGDLTAKNVNPDGKMFAGRYQFGDARLSDYNAVAGTNYTAKDMLNMPEAEQEKIADWHFSDISKYIKSEGLDKFIGTEINGVTLTESSLVAVAHLGGKSGLKQFLLTDGKYNEKDSNGTSLTDYARTHAMAGGLEETSTAGDRTQETFIIEPPRPEGASTSEKLAIARLSPAERSSFAQSLDLQNPKQKALHDDIQVMNAVESPVDMDSWLSGIGSVGTTMAQITKAQNSTNLSDDQRAKVIAALNTHLAKIQKDTDELNLTGETFVAPVSTDGGETFVRMSLQQRENGKYFAPKLNITLDPEQIDMPNLQSNEEIDALVSDAVRLQTEVFANMKIGRDGMTDLLRRSKSLDDLVAASDGAVLTTVGGRLPALLKRLENEFDQLEPYFRDKSPQEVMGSFSKIVEQDYQEALQGDATLANSEKAQLYSVYQSRVLELAYVYATAGLNQTRITDQDFLKALEIIQAGSDYPTFTKSIRSLVNQAYQNNKSSHDLYLKQPTYKAAMRRGGADEVYNEFMIPLDDYLATQPEDIQASLEWMRGATPEINTGNPAQGIEIRLNNYLNSPQYESAKDQLAGLNPTDRTTVIEMLSKNFNIPVDILERQFPRGTE
jgi:hypothetical protein